jgi:pimeloyl-ACP methyl ester carboxylesterase
VDRRSNLLEDLEPAAGAWRERTPEAAITALKAYMNNPAGRGGYISNNPTSVTSFMSEWGLDVHLRDLKAIVDQAREATPNVFLGGHSLGSVMTQAFAAYDFEGVPGYQLIKGMVLVGGGYDPGRHSPISDSFYLTGDPVPGVNQIHGLAQLRAGEKPPFFAEGYGFGFVTAVLFQIYDIGVQIALLDPEGTQLYDSGYMSRVIPYRATNAAVMALNMDDEFQYQPIARTSIGFLHIPPGKTLADVAVRVKDDPAGINPNGLWLPRDPGPNGVVHWNSEIRDLRTIGPELRGKEVNRLEDILRQKTPLLDTTGPEVGFNATDTLEWYLPTRLRTDIKKVIDLGRGAISPEIIAAQRERGGNPLTVTRNNLINIPVLGITAARAGMLVSAESFNRYRETTSIPRRKLAVETMEDYTHTDVVSSIAKTSKGSKKNIPQLLVSFIKKNTK